MDPYDSDEATPPSPAQDTENPTPGSPATDPDEGYASGELSDDDLVARAIECYRIGIDSQSRWREDALEDLNFLAGEQWDAVVRGQRDYQGRPAMTINRLPQFVRQITNEQRQSKPSITVSPMDSQSDAKTAEVFQGIVRNVEYSSNADAAYAAGGQSAAITGLGYWDVRSEYENERSFDQRLSICRIKNPLSVVMDPAAKEVAGDDAGWVHISWDMSKSDFEACYPGQEVPMGGDWSGTGDAPADWVVKDGVRMHEYRWISETQDTLIDVSGADEVLKAALQEHQIDLSSGGILASEVGPAFAQRLKDAKLPTRPTTKRKACYAKIAGREVVERGDLAGRYLQLVRVVGGELEIDGKPIYEGVIRHAKDTQRALNYFVSAEAEAIALAPKAPFIAAEGQLEGYAKQWQDANKQPTSVLTYKPTTISGVMVPKPERVMSEANIQAITQARQQAGQDLSDVTGIYPTQFGAPAPEQSGRAILARQSQGQTSNYHYTDNLAQAIRYTGRICLDLIPKIYSGPRIMRIVGEDGTHEMVPVNQPGEFRGEQVNIQLNEGRYDVAVSMGPSYLSRRQEGAAQMLELVRAFPQAIPIIGDLLVGSMDIPGGDVISDRLRKLLPPEVRPPDEKQPPQAVMAQTIQQLTIQKQQMDAVIGQLSQALHNAHDRIDSREQELASKERIAILDAQVALLTTKAKLNSTDANAALDRKLGEMDRRLELDGINDPIDDESTTEQPRGATAIVKALTQPQPPQGTPNGPRAIIPPGNPGASPTGPGNGALPGPGPIGPGIP